MVANNSRDDIIGALGRKGFVNDRIGKDIILFLVDESGKKTPVSTAFQSGSHGKVVNKSLFGRIARELHMNSIELDECVKCNHDHTWILSKARSMTSNVNLPNPTRHRPPIGP